MTILFRNDTHQELWRQHWCERCWQPDEAARRVQGKDTVCPIWDKALTSNRKPVQWDRTRNDQMVNSIRCNEYTDQPPTTARQVSQETQVPMFDVPATGTNFVPVDGWPDKPTKHKGRDHD